MSPPVRGVSRGFALPAVMTVLLAAAAAAGLVQLRVRADLAEAEALVRRAELDAAIDAAAVLTVADLIAATDQTPAASLDGVRPARRRIGAVEVEVRIFPEAGRINLNAVDPADVSAILSALGGGASTQSVTRGLAQARAQGRTFLSPADARSLFGDDGALFHRLSPFLSVHGGSTPDPDAAPAGVRRVWRDLPAPSADPRPALQVEAFPVLSLFLVASGEGGARRFEERTVAFIDGRLVTIERRPYDAEIRKALFALEEG